MLGQWWAHQLDLGWLRPQDRVRTALESLFEYNFKANFHGVAQYPRKFVADEDAGRPLRDAPTTGSQFRVKVSDLWKKHFPSLMPTCIFGIQICCDFRGWRIFWR
ncbi:glycoside hydrolase family 116 protein [Acidobacteria bacterium AH-259-O06]|nr:glycoside hydrolase family 116 protein [Acidobacteria bacterium AH-259-O06]